MRGRLENGLWIRFDVSFSVWTLARFCASAGPSHWAALQHLIEHLEGSPSFKLTYRRRSGVDNGLSGFADSDWGNSSSRRSTSGNSLHVRLQELSKLNQQWLLKVALGMRVQAAQTPRLALAQPRRYCPVQHVVHWLTGQELRKLLWPEN